MSGYVDMEWSCSSEVAIVVQPGAAGITRQGEGVT